MELKIRLPAIDTSQDERAGEQKPSDNAKPFPTSTRMIPKRPRVHTAPAILVSPSPHLSSSVASQQPKVAPLLRRSVTDLPSPSPAALMSPPSPAHLFPFDTSRDETPLPAVIQSLHKVVVEAASTMQTQELASASRAVHEVAGYLRDQVEKKLEGKSKEGRRQGS